MAVRPSAETTEVALARLMRGCPDGEAFRQEAVGLLRRAAGFDGWCRARRGQQRLTTLQILLDALHAELLAAGAEQPAMRVERHW